MSTTNERATPAVTSRSDTDASSRGTHACAFFNRLAHTVNATAQYRIVIDNQSGVPESRNYAIFVEPPELPDNQTVSVFANTWVTRSIPDSSTAVLAFDDSVTAWFGKSAQPFSEGAVVTDGALSVVKLGSKETYGSTLTLENHQTVPALKEESFRAPAGSFQFVLGSDFTTENNWVLGISKTTSYNFQVPVSTFEAAPDSTITVQPRSRYYVAQYDCQVGETVDLNKVKLSPPIDFTTGAGYGDFAAILVHGPSGSFDLRYEDWNSYALRQSKPASASVQSGLSPQNMVEILDYIQKLQVLVTAFAGPSNVRYICRAQFTTPDKRLATRGFSDMVNYMQKLKCTIEGTIDITQLGGSYLGSVILKVPPKQLDLQSIFAVKGDAAKEELEQVKRDWQAAVDADISPDDGHKYHSVNVDDPAKVDHITGSSPVSEWLKAAANSMAHPSIGQVVPPLVPAAPEASVNQVEPPTTGSMVPTAEVPVQQKNAPTAASALADASASLSDDTTNKLAAITDFDPSTLGVDLTRAGQELDVTADTVDNSGVGQAEDVPAATGPKPGEASQGSTRDDGSVGPVQPESIEPSNNQQEGLQTDVAQADSSVKPEDSAAIAPSDVAQTTTVQPGTIQAEAAQLDADMQRSLAETQQSSTAASQPAQAERLLSQAILDLDECNAKQSAIVRRIAAGDNARDALTVLARARNDTELAEQALDTLLLAGRQQGSGIAAAAFGMQSAGNMLNGGGILGGAGGLNGSVSDGATGLGAVPTTAVGLKTLRSVF